MRELLVRLHSEPVGTLTEERGRLSFTYLPDLEPEARLSLSMPMRDDAYGDDIARAFFGGLLPEGAARTQLARQLGISADNDFSLLEAIGGDCAGAVALTSPDDPPRPPGRQYGWLDDDALANLLAELPQRPLAVDPTGEVRLSLAGAQEKLPVFVDDQGRIGLPRQGAPSSHIIKTPIAGLQHSVANEWFCLTLAKRCGLNAVEANILNVAGQDHLLVTRYDRADTDDGLTRIHQEDAAQALGVPSSSKYEAEGGPGVASVVQLLRDHSRVPAADITAFMDGLVFNVLIANADAHAKNYSLLLDTDGPRLAPLYDLISTRVYTGLSRRLAMAIGGRDNPDYLSEKDWDTMAADAGLGVAGARRRRRELAGVVASEAGVLLGEVSDHNAAPLLQRVITYVERVAFRMAGS